MIETTAKIQGIHTVQIDLFDEEYEMLRSRAFEARMERTPRVFARKLFVEALLKKAEGQPIRKLEIVKKPKRNKRLLRERAEILERYGLSDGVSIPIR